MSADAASATLVGVVPWTKLYSAIQFFLGVNWVEYAGAVFPPRLRRLLPHRHPLFQWLNCTKITSMKAFAGKRKTWDDLAFPGEGDPPPVHKYISTMSEFIPDPEDPNKPGRPGDNFGTYDKVRLSLQYEPLTYPLLWDDQIYRQNDAEYLRYVTPTAEIQNIVLTIEGGLFVWYQGPDSGPLGEGHEGILPPRPVNAKLNKIIETQGVKFTWHRVPREWVEDGNRVMRTFAYLQGKVNRTKFMGFPPQTLRLLAPKKGPLRVEPCWVRNPPYLQYSYDIEIMFQYFNPEHGLSQYSDPQPDGSSPLVPNPDNLVLGHNIAIYGKNFRYYGVSHRSAPAPAAPKHFNELGRFGSIWQHWCGQ